MADFIKKKTKDGRIVENIRKGFKGSRLPKSLVDKVRKRKIKKGEFIEDAMKMSGQLTGSSRLPKRLVGSLMKKMPKGK